MNPAGTEGALTYLDLESAIMDAECAAAILSILEDHLTSSTEAGWLALGLKPRKDWCVQALTPTESRAIIHASHQLQRCVGEVSRIFYAAVSGNTL